MPASAATTMAANFADLETRRHGTYARTETSTCELVLDYMRMDHTDQPASSITVQGTNFVADLDMGRNANGTTVSSRSD